jgi:hypothetical protein
MNKMEYFKASFDGIEEYLKNIFCHIKKSLMMWYNIFPYTN